MPIANVNGANLYYQEQGSGAQSIVFAHGLLLNERVFGDQVHAFSDTYRCIAFDFRGHGQSEVTKNSYDMDSLTQDAADLIERLGCGPCHFVGHSLGSFIGLRLAIRSPELIKSLVLLGASADPEPRGNIFRYRLLSLVARLVGIGPVVGQVMPLMFGPKFLTQPEKTLLRDQWRRRLIANDVAGISRAVDGIVSRDGIGDELDRIALPTLVMVGDQDAAAPPARARRIHHRIRGSKLVIIPDAGHLPTIEEPERVNRELARFLEGLG